MENNDFKKQFLGSQNKIAVSLFAVFALQLVGSVIIAFMQLLKSSDEALVSAIVYAAYIGIPIFIVPLINKKPLKAYLPLKFKLPKDGFAAIFLCVGIMYFGQIFVWLLAELFGTFGVSLSPTDTTVYSGFWDYFMLFVSTAILPAFLEEFLMRGVVLGELAKYGKSVAIVYSGMLFGLMHMSPAQLPFACISGMIMAYYALETGSLWIGIIAHFINNALSVAILIMQNEMSASAFGAVSAVIDISILTLGLLSALYIFARKRSVRTVAPSARETMRVDLSGGLFTNMSGIMILYVVFTVLSTITTLILTNTSL